MRMSSLRLSALAILPLLAVIGCADGGAAPPSNPAPEPRATGVTAGELPPAQPAVPRQVTVRVIDEDDLAEVISGYRGKVILVDFWATWCLACIELFPHTVALHERFAEDGLAVLSVSFDQPESQPAVLGILEKHGAVFDNFISRYGAGIESAERFGLPGTLPQLLLFDRQGELAHTFPEPQSGVDKEKVERAVKELLEAGP